MIKLVFAVADNNAFGKEGHLPWKGFSEDLQRFKELTMGNWVVMGYNTWRSLPIALEGRKCAVVSGRDNLTVHRNKNVEDTPLRVGRCDVYYPFIVSIDKDDDSDVFIIGGKGMIEEAIVRAYAEEIYITRIKGDFEADVTLDIDEPLAQNYHIVNKEPHKGFTFEKYVRS